MAAVIRLIRDSSFKLSIVLGCCFLVCVGKGGVGHLVCVFFVFFEGVWGGGVPVAWKQLFAAEVLCRSKGHIAVHSLM